ncbi:MAG: RsmB/NOP family class I SAM-dependent RNA methyltransferase [Candidatus Dojkabacteria bacterium]|jgi:16S rRNA (cytosine1407-C5)-methyltransferase|nr:RsmB/NOP family class I SAM-dependent RNA methyltransferase [Candidatus Dojkabacteria bacterium]
MKDRKKGREFKRKLRTNFKRKRAVPFYDSSKEERYYTKEDIFISRMASILRVSKAQIVPIFSQRARTTIRLNSLKARPQDTFKSLKLRGYVLEEIPWAPDTYFVNNRDKDEVSQTEEYRHGDFYIQNLSSILGTLVLDPKPRETIVDLCSAPGSKTTHIAQLTNNKATILANEIEVSRTNSLRNVVEQFGATSVKITLSDAREFGRKYPDYFDKVLLDAPCSGEGMIYLKGPKPLRFWSIKKVKGSSTLQKELIESAFRTLKSGGTLVYSTCTLEPEENEAIVTYLLDKHRNAKVVDIDLISSDKFKAFKQFTSPGITHWSGNTYDPSVKKSIRILPSPEMMGFYIAKIVKA